MNTQFLLSTSQISLLIGVKVTSQFIKDLGFDGYEINNGYYWHKEELQEIRNAIGYYVMVGREEYKEFLKKYGKEIAEEMRRRKAGQ